MTATPATAWYQKMWSFMKEDDKTKAKEVTTAGAEVVGSKANVAASQNTLQLSSGQKRSK